MDAAQARAVLINFAIDNHHTEAEAIAIIDNPDLLNLAADRNRRFQVYGQL
jgi:hypothetical protein